jgi:hypothetical protein
MDVSSEDSCNGEETPMPWVAGSHHILGIKYLLSQFWHCQCLVLLAITGGDRCKAWWK